MQRQAANYTSSLIIVCVCVQKHAIYVSVCPHAVEMCVYVANTAIYSLHTQTHQQGREGFRRLVLITAGLIKDKKDITSSALTAT